MKKNSEKKTKVQEPKTSVNKEFIKKFILKNFERKKISEKKLKCINYFFIKQLNKISKLDLANIDFEIQMTSKIFTLLISNIQQNTKCIQSIPFFNDSLYLLIEFTHKTLMYYLSLAEIKKQQWDEIENIFTINNYVFKNINKISEPNIEEITDRKLMNFNSVDQMPQIEKNPSTVMTQTENMQILINLCEVKPNQDYSLLYKSIAQIYIEKQDKKIFIPLILKMIEKSFIAKKLGITQKLIKFMISISSNSQIEKNLEKLIAEKEIINLNQIFENIKFQKYFSALKLLKITTEIIQSFGQKVKAGIDIQELIKLFNQVAEFSNYFTEITQMKQKYLNQFYQNILRILLKINEIEQDIHNANKKQNIEKSDANLQKLCKSFSKIIKKLKKNCLLIPFIKIQDPIKIFTLIEFIKSPSIVNFLFETLPDLLQKLPKFFSTKSNPLTLSIYLKHTILNANNKQQLFENFAEFYQKISSTQITNFEFASAYCILMTVKNTKEILENMIKKCIEVLSLNKIQQDQMKIIVNLFFIICLINGKQFPILKFSIKQLINKLLQTPTLLVQKLVFPPLIINEVLLFDSRKIPYIPQEQFQTLTRLININIHGFTKQIQLIYYIIIQINNINKQIKQNKKQKYIDVEQPKQLQIISRMRLANNGNLISYGYNSIQKAFSLGLANKIQIFHSLIKFFTILQNKNIEENQYFPKLNQLLFNNLISYYTKQEINQEDLIQIYEVRTKKPENSMEKFIPFIQSCKSMKIVKFYSEAKLQEKKLHFLIMELILKILIKTSKENLIPNEVFIQCHLLYYPFQSIYLKKDIIQSPLLNTYLMMAILVYIKNNSILSETKRNLLNQVENINQYYSESNKQILKIIAFKNIDFIKFLFDNILIQYLNDKEGSAVVVEDTFYNQLLNSLIQINQYVRQYSLSLMKQTSLLSQKIALIFKRLKYNIRHKKFDAINNSKLIYNTITKMQKISSINTNSQLSDIFQLDQCTQFQTSCYLLQEIILLSDLFVKDEDLVCKIFEYLNRLIQSQYHGVQREIIVHHIPKLICQVFNIVPKKYQNKVPIIQLLQSFEKNQKNTACFNLNPNNYNISTFRCLDCDQKKLVCYGCVVSCHKKHTVIHSLYSQYNTKFSCLCHSISLNQCKYKKSANIPKKEYSREANSYRFGELGIMPPYNSYGEPLDPFSLGNPFGQKRKLDKYQLEADYLDEQQNVLQIFEPFDGEDQFQHRRYKNKYNPDIKKLMSKNLIRQPRQGRDFRERPGPPVKINQVKQNKQQVMQIEEQQISDCYNQLPQPIQQQKLQHQQGAIIKSQSYLIQMYFQIAQQLCISNNRKISMMELEPWKINPTIPTLDKLCEINLKLFNANYIKLRLNNQSQLSFSPIIVRKPVAIKGKICAILSSTNIMLFENKKIFGFILNSSVVEPIYHHNLNFEAHSIEFSPINDTLCVVGLHNLHILSVNFDNFTISKQNTITYTNKNQYINKIQYLQIGVLIGDYKNLKLLPNNSKNVSLLIQGPKEGLIREWSVMKVENQEKKNLLTYNLVVITSYGSIYQLQFDENDKGQKALTKKVNGDVLKKNRTGSTVLLTEFGEGKRIMVVGFKDPYNFVCKIDGDNIQSPHQLKFNVHPNLQKNTILGHISKAFSTNQKVTFISTAKLITNKDLSIHSGQLMAFSISQNEKYQIQPLFINQTDPKCEGFGILHIDDTLKCIIAIYEDGSVSLYLLGEYRKQSISKAIKQLDQQQNNIKVATNENTIQEIRKVFAEKLKITYFDNLELNPLIEFKEREMLKRNTDYKYQKNQEEITLKLENFQKVPTGLYFNVGVKITLPTRTIDNVLELGFSFNQIAYFYGLGYIKFKMQKASKELKRNQKSQKEYIELGLLQRAGQSEQNLEYLFKKISQLNKGGNVSSNDIELYGENFDIYLNRFNSLKEILAEPKGNNNKNSILEILKVLQIFLTEIRDTNNNIFEDQVLMHFIDLFRPLLGSVDYEYYKQLRNVIELALQIYNNIQGHQHPRIDYEFEPNTFLNELLIKQLQSKSNNTIIYLINYFYQVCSTKNIQIFYYLISKYPSILKKLYKKYMTILTTKQLTQKKETIDPILKQILCLLIVSYSTLVKRNQTNSQWIISLIKIIFIKYNGNFQIRQIIYQFILKFCDQKCQQWIQTEVKSIEENMVQDIPLKLPSMKQQPQQISELEMLQMSQMNDEELLKFYKQLSLNEFKEKQRQIRSELNEIEQEKFEGEQQNQLIKSSQNLEGGNFVNPLLKDLFFETMKVFENQSSLQQARYSILLNYTLFKIFEKKSPESIQMYLKVIHKWLNNLNIKKTPSLITLYYLALFSYVIKKSSYLTTVNHNNLPKYNQVKEVCLKRVQGIFYNQQSTKTKKKITISEIIKGKTFTLANINYPYSLITILRPHIQPCSVILSLKCYQLLEGQKQSYKVQRDKVIYKECMSSGNINKIYKKAKKRPQTWKQCADIEWLENFIDDKKQGWQLALQLLEMYYKN